MGDTNTGHTPPHPTGAASTQIDAAWLAFGQALAGYLATMVDPAEDDHLIVELPGPTAGDGARRPPYAQFAAFGDGHMLHAEVSGNAHLLPQYRLGAEGCAFLARSGWRGNVGQDELDLDPANRHDPNWFLECPILDAGPVAGQVVWVLRNYFHIPHPHLLTYHAWGPASANAGMLGLCATDDVPADPQPSPATTSPAPTALAAAPADTADLRGMVTASVRRRLGSEPTVDDDGDGDIVLQHMGQPVWVSVCSDQPAVQILARVAHNVHSRRATAVEIGLLNRDYHWVKWVLRERTVWQTLTLPADPFASAHLDGMLHVFLQAMTATRDDLAYRVGAQVA